ncbi:MAG: hypothetical protein ACREC0_15515 [Methylocella sp.]
MEHEFTKMSFVRLREGDRRYIQEACKDEAQRSRLCELLNEYLCFLGAARHLDDEKLFILGRELDILWPKQLQRELAESVKENVDPKIAGIFLSGLGIALEPNSNAPARARSPSRQNLENLLSQLANQSFNTIQSRVMDFCQKHSAYAEHSGYALILLSAFGQIGEAILRMSAKDRQQGAGLVRELACTALRWEPWNGYFWVLWARAFLAQGAIEAAELLYWDTIRRIPSNAHARNQLVMLLQRLEGRMWEAIELARESAALFPRDEAMQNVLANVLLNSGDPANYKEAIDLLIRSLNRTPDYDAHKNLLGATLAEDFATNSSAREYYREIVAQLPNNPKLLGKIGQVMFAQASGLDSAESFFCASVARFDTNAALRNQLAGVLVANGATEKRDEAIRILKETAVSNPTDHYSRNHLAETLAVSGDPDERKEAIGILQATTQDELTDNNYSRELLAKLTGGAPVPSQGAEAPVSKSLIDEPEEDLLVIEANTRLEQHLPTELSNLARMSRLRFRLAHSQGEIKGAAIEELRETLNVDPTIEEVRERLNTDPTFAYAQLLAVQQGLWAADSSTLPTFPAAFELALRDEDIAALARLAKQYPRLEALTLVARAVFGDADAVRLVQPTLDSPDNAKAGIEKMLRERVGPILFVIVGGRLAATSLEESRKRAIAELSKINEWAIGGGDWRVPV